MKSGSPRPTDPIKNHSTAALALSKIAPESRIFVHGAAATPSHFIEELIQQGHRLNAHHPTELIHLHTDTDGATLQRLLDAGYAITNLFVGSQMRKWIDHPRVEYLPCFLSEMPDLFRSRIRPIDVALVTVSPMDSSGFHSLGTSVDIARAAVDCAPLVIAQINSRMPRTHGNSFVHHSKLTVGVEVNSELPESFCRLPHLVEKAIGRNVASLLFDGACIQAGIGAVPDAVLDQLHGFRHLGIHTEMASDGMLRLIQSGAVDHSRKKIHAGKMVATFLSGTRALYDFVHDNPSVALLGADEVNHPLIISKNPGVVSINSAVEVDLTGQVCADSVGHRIISGVGGQMDFVQGASLSSGGKSIFALTSRSANGQPRIVFELQKGAGVVTTRAQVHFVATEYGVADLYGKTLTERARALISIAHPEDRELLTAAWQKQK